MTYHNISEVAPFNDQSYQADEDGVPIIPIICSHHMHITSRPSRIISEYHGRTLCLIGEGHSLGFRFGFRFKWQVSHLQSLMAISMI